MKKFRLTLIFTILIAAFAMSAFGQSLTLLVSSDEFTCEDLLSQLDMAVVMSANTSAVAFVVIHDRGDAVENKFTERFVTFYAAVRKLDDSRFRIITSSAEDKKRIEIWLGESGNAPAIRESEFSFDLPNSSRKFSDAWIVLGANDYEEECPACCIFKSQITVLGEFLRANPKLSARVGITGKSKAGAARLGKLIRKDLREFSDSRVKILFDGRNEGLDNLSADNFGVEIRLIAGR